MRCFECGSEEGLEEHHVVPQSLGGTKTVVLCYRCHDKVHRKVRNTSTSELTKQALLEKRLRGERTGTVPYGFHVDEDGKTLVYDKYEMAVITLCLQLREGGNTYQAITDQLNELGYRSRNGNLFQLTSVYRIINQRSFTKVIGVVDEC